ncbi:hypothetical protein [Bradyrhizobium sp. OAE829]|uniref:hypothetical protein n=1 Tax=Bradyrhizobium sp. OAE829 TaxID=2663807 RepID=UPI00178A7B3A
MSWGKIATKVQFLVGVEKIPSEERRPLVQIIAPVADKDVRYSSDLWSWARTSDGGADMKMVTIVVAVYLGTCALACAQSSAGSAAGSTGAGGTAGSTLSNGNTISGIGGSPGPNTSNALNRDSTGNNLGAPPNRPSAGPAATHGNAVDTPAAKAATQNFGNTDAGVLKK